MIRAVFLAEVNHLLLESFGMAENAMKGVGKHRKEYIRLILEWIMGCQKCGLSGVVESLSDYCSRRA